MVRRPAKSASARSPRATRRLSLTASVSLLTLALAGALAPRAHAETPAAQTLPGTEILAGGRWTGARLPTVAQTNNGLVMTIKQEQKAALLDWSKFNVGAGEEVHFDQGGADWIALNRIFDANPSQIAGKITAKGQVWLANTNGVVFKGGAQVNTASILVTTAVVPDSILDTDQLLSSRPRTSGTNWGNVPGLLDGAKGDIVIEKGAKLTLKSSDTSVTSSAILLGVNVINKGEIEVTDGQVVMMAGEDFALRASAVGEQFNYDFLHGMYGLVSAGRAEFGRFNNEAAWNLHQYERAAEVGGMKVVNEGSIISTRGSILMQGAQIDQLGLLRATTGVRQRTGTMLLRAGFGFDDADLIYSGIFDNLAGDVTFGEGSVTEVVPEHSDDASPALETFTGVNRSRISVVGRNVLMEEDSTLRAKSGLITIDGNYSAMMSADLPGTDKGRPGSFVMKDGALIDVSGVEGVERDVSDNVVTVEVRANELSASPAQRDGILYGEDVKVDIRQGSSIVDWTGALANRNLTAEDRSINGGEVQIRALSNVSIEDGAKIDLSGGSAVYKGGWVEVSTLIAADNRVFDIASADPATPYVGLTTTSHYEDGYTEGGDAGKLEILSSSQKLFGRVTADTVVGEHQLAAGLVGVKPVAPTGAVDNGAATRLPKGGTVTLGTGSEALGEYFFDQVFVTADQAPVTMTVNGGEVTLDPTKLGANGLLSEGGYTQVMTGPNGDQQVRLAPGWVVYNGQPVELRQALVDQGYEGEALEALLAPDAVLPAGFVRGRQAAFSFIEDDFASGVQTLSILNKPDAKPYALWVLDNAKLQVADGGALMLDATPAMIGKNVSLTAAGGKISIFGARIGDGTKISVAGTWTNDIDNGGQWGGYVDGGSLSVSNAIFDGDVTLDASGGGWWKQTTPATPYGPGDFQLVKGKGGSIAVQRNWEQAGGELLDRAHFELGGLGGSGSLTLAELGDVVIGPAGGSAGPGGTYLSDQQLADWGAGALNIAGGMFPMALSDDVVGRVSVEGVLNPNVLDPQSPDRYLVPVGGTITAEALAAIRAANAEVEAYNATVPPGGQLRSPVAQVAVGADLQVAAGARLDLVQKADVLDVLPATIATGADLSDFTTATVLPAIDRKGVALQLGAAGNVSIDADASLKVDTNGSIAVSGYNVDLAGDLIARSGDISVSGASLGKLHIASTALLDARGEVITRKVPGAVPGETWTEGAVWSGGSISVGGGYVLVDKGALFDVSGVAGTLTVDVPSRLMSVRVDRLIGGDAGTISIGGAEGYFLGDLRGDAGVGFKGVTGRAGVLNLSGGQIGNGPDSSQIDNIITNIVSIGLETFGFSNLQELAVAWFGYAPEQIEPIPITDPNALRAFLTEAFAPALEVDGAGYLALDPAREAPGAEPPAGGASFTPRTPAGYVLQTDQAGFVNAMRFFVDYLSGYNYGQTFDNMQPGRTFHLGKAPLTAAAGFDTVNIGSPIRVDSDLTLQAQRALTIGAIAADGADLTLKAPIITFDSLGGTGPTRGAVGGDFSAIAQQINVKVASFDGFSKVLLEADRSLSGGGDPQNGAGAASIYAPGELTIRAGQVYPYTGSELDIRSDVAVNFESSGHGGAAPLSAGGKLVVEAPVINQGGVLAAPFGAIELTGDAVTFLPGSLTTVSADGRTILYGHTVDGAAWYGPTPGAQQEQQLNTPPEKRIVVTGDDVDLQAGAIIDARGGGDVLGLEFVQGPKGATNILTGEGVFAISPVFGADVSLGQSPSGAPREQLAVGDVIWLPAFDGHAAGYYSLLPAEYALTPGAYRITVAAKSGVSDARQLGDGSFILTGHQAAEQGIAFDDQAFTTFQLVSGAGVRDRSEFIETSGNTFFSSERFLTGLERNGGVFNADPRLPVDGGFMTIAARNSLQLNGEFSAQGASASDRGGMLDIAADNIVVASAGTDISDLGEGYLRLDPAQLSNVAESLLIGGVRRQGAAGLEIVTGYESRNPRNGAPQGETIGAKHIVVRNGESDALTGPEILFAATDDVVFDSGSVVRASGDGAQASDILIRPELPTLSSPQRTYPAEDRGAFVRVSNLGDAQITRTNPFDDRGDVVIHAGARLEATDAVAVNATRNTTLEPGAILKAGVIEAAAGVVSFGDAPSVEGGLVLNDAAFAALAGAKTLRLRSYTTFDVYGDVALQTANDLVLDGAGLVNVDGASATSLGAKTLTLLNTNAAAVAPASGGGRLDLTAESLTFGEGAVALGYGAVDVDAKGRVLFDGAGKVSTPGDMTIAAAEIAASSGASHGVVALGDLNLVAQAQPANLAAMQTAGATIDLQGRSVGVDLPVRIASGVFRAHASDGDVTVGGHAKIDASGSAINFYEVVEYLAAGGVGLTSDNGDVTVAEGAVLDVSGGQTGDAGEVVISAGRGVAVLDGQLKSQPGAGGKGGAFTLQTATLDDFGALNSKLNDSGFSRSRRFAVVNGDVTLDGETRVDQFELSTGVGSITVDGGARIVTTREKGGQIVIASGGDLVVEDGALLDASAKGQGDQRGGLVSLQVGDSGALNVGAATLKVGGKGAGEAGEVRLRARQVGGDVAVDRYAAAIDGGAVTLEAYKVTDLGDGDHVIDTALQDQVIGEAAAFMSDQNLSGIRTRLGQADPATFQITPGVEIRSGGDLTLADEWNLADARFGGAPGTLTLRAGGDLAFDANLSDGFLSASPQPAKSAADPTAADSPLTNDRSWSYNLVAGADFSQTNVLATKASAAGEGDVLVNALVRTGTGDINVAASGDLTYAPPRKYSIDITDTLDGQKNVAVTYPDGTVHSYVVSSNDWNYEAVDPELGAIRFSAFGGQPVTVETGGRVFLNDYDGDSGRIAFNVQYVDGSIYTAGKEAAPLADFDSPTHYVVTPNGVDQLDQYRPASFLEKGGDVTIAVGGDIIGAGDAKLDANWSGRRGALGDIDPAGRLDAPFITDVGGVYQQTAFWILPDSFRQGVGALGGGDVTIRAGGTVDNLAVVLPTSTRVAGGRTAGEAKVLDVRGGGDLDMQVGGDLLGGSYWVSKGAATIKVDGKMDRTADPDIENPYYFNPGLGGYSIDRRASGAALLILDDATMRITTGGDARFAGIRSGANPGWTVSESSWVGYTDRTKLEVISSGGDVQYYAATGEQYSAGDILPAKTRLVSISGSVVIGDWAEAPRLILTDSYPDAEFDLLARKDIAFWNLYNTGQSQDFHGYDAPSFALSWGNPGDIPRALNPFNPSATFRFDDTWGAGGPGYGRLPGEDNPFEGRSQYARIYAAEGDIYAAQGSREAPIYPSTGYAFAMGNFIFGYETRIKAGDDIRLSKAQFLNQDAADVSMVQAGGSIYYPDLGVFGEGRLWVQAGDEIYMGTTPGRGIRAVEDIDYAEHVEGRGADVTVLAGIDQAPEYDAFFDYYLTGGGLGSKPAYLSEYYTFDEIGLATPKPTVLADGQTEVSIYAVDLINYWNKMNGRPTLALEEEDGTVIPRGTLVSKISKADYDAALAWLADLDPARKQGLATQILFAEIKTAGREAVGQSKPTDPANLRSGDPTRGYSAIGRLFPGAQRKPGEEKQAGEARWFGDLIMTDSQIRTDGGGDIEILVPGGIVQLASLGVTNTDPNASGVLSQDRGDVSVLTYGDYIVNQSRTMTADDGDILIWSSFGNIDAGKGRKSSLAIPPVIFPVDNNAITRIVRSGLPNGAGIATLNRVDGTPGGDVDLYAFNGIVNAGDAGIRASRDLFVGALEIRGLDNITVGGATNVELNTEKAELGPINLENFAQHAEDEAMDKAFDMTAEVEKLRTVTQTILTGSVVSFGEDPADDERKKHEDRTSGR